MKIVLVDSAQINVTAFENLVRMMPDCEPVSFTDSLAALDWCFSNEPDLVVVSHLMPLLSGTELVEKFRASYPDIPVLMVMESRETELRFHALQIGVTDFLIKPLDHVEFLARAKSMLALRKSQKELAKRTSWLLEEVNEAYQALELNASQQREIIDMVETNLKLEQDSRAKNDFLARVSHDLRTPLTTILGYSDMLSRDTRMTQHNGELSVIRRNAHHLLALIDELLEFARNSIGTNQIKPVPLYLHALIDHVMQQAEALAQEAGNRAVLELHGQLPQVVVLDPVLMRRVLFNLLANAAKFTRKGTLTLRVGAEAVEGGAAETLGQQALLFEVIDTGIGIDPAEQERIFEPFYRASSVTSGIPGSGLGLAICRQWAQAMGGSVTVASVPGQGSCFSFRLICPLANEADIDIADAASSTEIDGAERQILLVEDVAEIRHYLTDLLTGAGFMVTSTANGREALLCAGQNETPIVAVITDQAMPEMDGWSLLSALRLQYGQALPVILFSATPAQPPADWPTHVQFDACLLKPVDSGRLLGTLAHLLKLQSADVVPAWQTRSAAVTTIRPGEMLLPNDACLKEFQSWAERGALSILESHAHELAAKHPEYAAFARFVLTRAEALDLEGIAACCMDARRWQEAG